MSWRSLGPPFLSSIIDGAFLVAVAGVLWRDVAAAESWSRTPIGVLISVYAGANFLYHVLHLATVHEVVERFKVTRKWLYRNKTKLPHRQPSRKVLLFLKRLSQNGLRVEE